MAVDTLTDVMRYYYFAVIPLYCLAAAAVAAAILAFKGKKLVKYSVLIALFALLGNLSQFFFLGVLADNQVDTGVWGVQAVLLTAVCLGALVLSAVRLFIKGKTAQTPD